jgi:2-oxoisovalerate dehydrogenase E2 component (dihydrolipoyl transacylase)
MSLFYLPDLGEGLPDAEIRQWYVNAGDIIKADTPMVAMETAKAVVDIPAPFSGKVIQLYGKPGDIIKTGTALIDIKEEKTNADNDQETKTTVVGDLQTTTAIVEEPATGIKSKVTTTNYHGIKATPAIRALAKKMQVDLTHCKATGSGGQITVSDIEQAAQQQRKTTTAVTQTETSNDYQPLRGVRRAMAIAITKSHQRVVPITLLDDADIHTWPEKTDVTLRLIQAIMAACLREPRLNAWFDDKNLSLRPYQAINLGIAMDAPEGLLVPVIKNIAQCSAADLRNRIDHFKTKAKNRSLAPEDLTDATFILSNVGVFAGRYANPIIIPPMVAILAVGRIREAVVADQGKPVVHRLLPLSLTVDHRTITGGEAARFLSALILALQTA